MRKIVVLIGSMRKGGNTQLLAQAFAEGAGKQNDVEIISVADYKVNPCIVFDAIKVQYQLVLDFFHLEDIGMVLVRGVKEKGDIVGNAALKEAYNLGMSVE